VLAIASRTMLIAGIIGIATFGPFFLAGSWGIRKPRPIGCNVLALLTIILLFKFHFVQVSMCQQ
jgi:hypothetical protein